MRIDAEGMKFITSFEGLRLKAYQDQGGVWTIGYGHTATAKAGMKITKEAALRLFDKDIQRFEACVESAVEVPMTQNMFNALVSFAYNRGCNGFRSSELLELVNAGRYDEAASQWFTTSITAGGKKSNGLVKRRKGEANLFASGTTQPRSELRDFASWLIFGSIKGLAGRAS